MNSYKFAIFFLISLLLTIPSISISWLSSYDDHRIFQAFALSVVLLLTSLSFSKQQKTIKTWLEHPTEIRFFIYLIFIFGFTSSLFSALPDKAALEVFLFVILFFNIVILSGFFNDNNITKEFLPILIFLSMVFYLTSVLSAYFSALSNDDSILLVNLFPGFSNIRFFNHYHWWLLPLIPYVIYWATNRKGSFQRSMKATAWFCGAGWWMLLLASESRGAMLSAIVGCIALIAIMGRQSLIWLKVQGLTASSGGILFWLMFNVIGQLERPSRLVERIEGFTQDPARLELWRGAIQMIMENPLLGVGPMHFAYYPNGIAASAHNTLLQWAAEWGPLAAMALAYIVLRGFFSWTRSVRAHKESQGTEDNLLDASLTVALFGAAAHSMVSGIDIPPISQMLLVIFVALALARHKIREGNGFEGLYPVIGRWHSLAIVSVVTLCIAGLAQGMWPEAYILMTSNDVTADWSGKGLYYPRFWQRGLIGEGH